MSSNKKKKISYFNTSVTSVISVSMVLLLLGIAALIGISAREASQQIKENIGFDISTREEATPEQVLGLKRQLERSAYASAVKYVSKDDAMRFWKEETGEDLVEVLGFNPLTAEFEVRVKAQYASVDSLSHIEANLRRHPVVDEIKIHRDQVEAVNAGLGQAAMVLLVIAVAMLIISIALINNTVRMTVYSRRFLIHTMKLVGATPAFIRKPIVVSNLLNGALAGSIAVVLLAGVVYYLSIDGLVGMAVKTLLPLEPMLIVGGSLIVIGALMCSIAAFFAANRYIRLDYDKLF